MKKVIVRAPALSQSGYGEHARFLLKSLRTQPENFDIYLANINWGQTSWIWADNEERNWIDYLINKTTNYINQGGKFDMSLQVTIPNEWEKLAPINIGVTAGIETTKIAPAWLGKSLEMDKIIVTSEHAKYGFENTAYEATNNQTNEQFMAKVTCPIEVVNYPIKNTKSAKLKLDLKYDFNFLVIGTWIARKNLENTIKWFVEEFRDQEVGLIIKTSMAKNCVRDKVITAARLKSFVEPLGERKCQIKLLHGDMSEEEVMGLYNYRKIKCLINIAHGEGYGLPLFEAAYNGLPIITVPWGGQVDFLYMSTKNKKGKIINKEMFTPVSYQLGKVQPSAVWDGVIQADSSWVFAKEWDYKKSLKKVVKNYKALKTQANKLKKHLQETHNEELIYAKMCNTIYKQSEEEKQWTDQLEAVEAV
jgi:glycosyltransferase involved in cell wall biosynthesis